MHAEHDHDLGLVHDLRLIERRLVERRRALAWFGGAGLASFLAGCGSDGGGTTTASASTGTAAATTATTTTTGSASTGTTATATTTTGTSDQCIAVPTETAGPYPADGTNTARGSTSNVLTASGILRSDIRASFIGSTTVAAGVAVTLTLQIVNTRSSCAPLAGYAVYLWHCDKDGNYSLYDVPAESYLRGVQVTNAAGQVTFTTIFPACYAGRFPHMHFEVFASQSAATSGRAALLTSQLAMPAAACTAVYSGDSRYATSVSRYAQVSTASDGIFGDNSAAQITAMTPVLTGSVAAGYTGLATIGLAV